VSSTVSPTVYVSGGTSVWSPDVTAIGSPTVGVSVNSKVVGSASLPTTILVTVIKAAGIGSSPPEEPPEEPVQGPVLSPWAS